MALSQLNEDSITCGAIHDSSFTQIVVRKTAKERRLTTAWPTCLLEQNHQALTNRQSFGTHQKMS